MGLKEQYDHWKKKVLDKWLEKDPERKEKFITDIGLETERLYTPLHFEKIGFDYERDLGFPGQYPFTRGITPTMNRSTPFIISAYSGFGTPEECNKRYKKMLEWGGLDEITIAADLPTQLGYDSDDVMARGEVGKVGVAIDSLLDMEKLFDGIPLNKFRQVSMLASSFAPIGLSLFIALGEKQGLTTDEYVVELQNDILKEYVARGTYIFPIEPSIRMGMDVIAYCAEMAPHWHPISICANHINAAGAGSMKANAFALANALCYIKNLMERGLPIDKIAPLFTMHLDEREDFFTAIADLRATRRLWARLMKQKFQAVDPRSMALRVRAYAHGGETLHEPLNNIARLAIMGLAFVLGGVQFLVSASYDEVVGIPTEEGAKNAIRIQQILAYELGITNSVDPLGGSYYIETLTNQIEKGITETLDMIEEKGGAIKAISNGLITREMINGATRRKKEFDSGERLRIAGNLFRPKESVPSRSFRVDSAFEKRQIENLQSLKKERNQNRVKETLDYVRQIAKKEDNLVLPILEAVRSYATIGEITQVLREIYGEYQKTEYFGMGR